MKAALKKKWVKALRGGKYMQGMHLLKSSGAYCCLGVLMEIAGIKIGKGQTYPTNEQCDELGIPAIYWPDGVTHILTRMNDSGSDFAEIADYIEKTL